MKKLSVLLALIGVGVALFLLSWVDIDAVWAAMTRIGWGGFAALLAWQGVMFVILGLAWALVMPGTGRGLLIWGRMVRDAATTCLPFSPVGGFVIGARAITLHGVAWPTAAAGTVVDVTAEVLAQGAFALFGAATALILLPGTGFAVPLAMAVAVAMTLLLLLLRQRAWLGRAAGGLTARLLGDNFAGQDGVDRIRAALGQLTVPRRLVRGGIMHLVGWISTGIWTWLALHLLGAHAGLIEVLALEALLDALIAASFIVPAAAGVQEAGYIGIGALFGVPADMALAVSLLRRGKDLVWGVPILGFWQWHEVRRLAR